MSNNNYLDHLMTNQPLDTDSISSFSEHNVKQVYKKIKPETKTKNKKSKTRQIGGDVTESASDVFSGNIPHVPHGGFPPLYICDQFKQEEETTKEREYTTHKNAVSIKDILKTRRDTTPFISM